MYKQGTPTPNLNPFFNWSLQLIATLSKAKNKRKHETGEMRGNLSFLVMIQINIKRGEKTVRVRTNPQGAVKSCGWIRSRTRLFDLSDSLYVCTKVANSIQCATEDHKQKYEFLE